MKNIVIFASGNGTNAQRIITYFEGSADVQVVQVLSNNKNAKVLDRASAHQIPAWSFNKKAFYETTQVLDLLKSVKPDLIVLAGFLWLFPETILQAFPDKVINIHPALLPDFGGKGMYGIHVHRAVIAYAKATPKQTYTGITIHTVTPEYDKGSFLHQEKVAVTKDDTPESIAQKVHDLEYEYLPKVIEKLLTNG